LIAKGTVRKSIFIFRSRDYLCSKSDLNINHSKF